MKTLMNKLKGYRPANKKIKKSSEEVLKNAERLYTIRNEIIEAFKDSTFFVSEEAAHKYETKDSEQLDTINIPNLETEESAEQRTNKKGQGLKILTPEQMLSRLAISLAKN